MWDDDEQVILVDNEPNSLVVSGHLATQASFWSQHAQTLSAAVISRAINLGIHERQTIFEKNINIHLLLLLKNIYKIVLFDTHFIFCIDCSREMTVRYSWQALSQSRQTDRQIFNYSVTSIHVT